jgi:hypothetical protein
LFHWTSALIYNCGKSSIKSNLAASIIRIALQHGRLVLHRSIAASPVIELRWTATTTESRASRSGQGDLASDRYEQLQKQNDKKMAQLEGRANRLGMVCTILWVAGSP